MGNFLSVDLTHLERAARFHRMRDVINILERRPDLDPKKVMRKPAERTTQETLLTEWIHYVTPANDGPSSRGLFSGALNGLKMNSERFPEPDQQRQSMAAEGEFHQGGGLNADYVLDIPADFDEEETEKNGKTAARKLGITNVDVVGPATLSDLEMQKRERQATQVTTVYMSPMSWALDHLDTNMAELFLEASLSDIQAPVCLITRQYRLNQSTPDEWRFMGRKTYSLSMIEYLISMKLCPHLFHSKEQKVEMLGRVSDLIDMVTSNDTFSLEFQSQLKSFSMQKPTLRKMPEQQEPLLHLAIRYMATYFTMNNGHYHTDSSEESRGKLWCRRHKQVMNIKSRDWADIRHIQFEKQKLIFEKLLQCEKLDLLEMVNCQEQTALHYAVQYDCGVAVSLLLNFSSKNPKNRRRILEKRDRNDMTPLFYALSHGKYQIAEQLIKAGADYFAECTDAKQTPLDLIFAMGADASDEIVGTYEERRPLMQVIDKMEAEKLHAF